MICQCCNRQFEPKVHRLLCGDSRDQAAVAVLFGDARANVVITSPPYASQRKYDESSGFKPVPAEDYLDWFKPVATNIASVLAEDGSYFLNLAPHSEHGVRHLYVMDLVIAHQRLWGWRFIDELCWRKTNNGVPGTWPNRFKNAWEPVFHFCRQQSIKFRPGDVGHASADCFDYSPNNPQSNSGSGMLGSGSRGNAAGTSDAVNNDGRYDGVALPSNVIEVRSESSQGSHSAPFPRALVEFFVKAFSDAGDVIFDPFMGSGTTMAAAAVLKRLGHGCEISPAYCDVIIMRMLRLSVSGVILAATGQSFAEVAADRGVAL